VIVSRVLVSLALLGAMLLVAAPAEARVAACTSLSGNCGFYLVCVGDQRDANGNFQGCTVGVQLIPCDPGACPSPI